MKVFNVYLNSMPVAGMQNLHIDNVSLAMLKKNTCLDTLSINGVTEASNSSYRYLVYRTK